MDETDRKILEFILDDARIPFSRIARSVGVSIDTISKRYGRMKQEGVIKFCTVLLDLAKLGQGLVGALTVSVVGGQSTEVEKKIASLDEVFLIGKTFGAFDSLALVTARDLEHLEWLKEKVSCIEGVEHCDMSVFTSGLTLFPIRQLHRRGEDKQ